MFKPAFFIGRILGTNSVDINISAYFTGVDSLFEKSLSFEIETDTSKKTDILPAMLANEQILDLLSISPPDTTQIVRLAVQHNLLTDYTAMLCLEPDDSTRKKPDEPFTSIELKENSNNSTESLAVDIYPNPFNIRTLINFNLPEAARVKIAIYNILGQLVRLVDWTDYEKGSHNYAWNGKGDFGSEVSSGIYLIQICVKLHGNETKEIVWKGKIVLMK
ncbi:T9SS type A sorting domain-containing protein [candidate division KSB1 bacterium]|nr:T9SS type A sorting domain-containing protein [candidate division KSB1 bacterium]